MRDDVVRGDVDGGALVEQHVLVHRRRRRVLHSAEDEVGDHHLSVFVPRVGDAEEFAEMLDHVGRAAESATAVGLAPRGTR